MQIQKEWSLPVKEETMNEEVNLRLTIRQEKCSFFYLKVQNTKSKLRKNNTKKGGYIVNIWIRRF